MNDKPDLDDFKQQIAFDAHNSTEVNNLNEDIERLVSKVSWQQKTEILVATLALGLVMFMAFSVEMILHKVLEVLSIGAISDTDIEPHVLIYLSLWIMACYCGYMMLKYWRLRHRTDEFSLSVRQKLKTDYQWLQSQNSWWLSSGTWALFVPIVIGQSFFWGLSVTLTGSWSLNGYLLMYQFIVLIHIVVVVIARNTALYTEIRPMLLSVSQALNEFEQADEKNNEQQ